MTGRCWWCGSTRHDSARCAGRRHDLAQAHADECAPYPADNHGQFDRPTARLTQAQRKARFRVA